MAEARTSEAGNTLAKKRLRFFGVLGRKLYVNGLRNSDVILDSLNA
jgi:hypothetical protein